jgi:hypothetical protein
VAYDEDLANRIRELVLMEDGIAEKRMFGGLAFLINGNMSVSVSGRGGLLLRVDPSETEALLRLKYAYPFEMRGRCMGGCESTSRACTPGASSKVGLPAVSLMRAHCPANVSGSARVDCHLAGGYR